MRPAIHSLRARLILLVLVAIVPSLGGALAVGFDDRDSSMERAEREVSRTANLISGQLDQIVEATHATLVGFAAVPSVRYHDAAGCSSFAASLRNIYPIFANLAATDATGYVFCSGYPLTEPIVVSDRQYFIEALRTRAFVGSSSQTSRSTGKPSISYAFPVLTDQGEVLAVVVAALDLDMINKEAGGFDIPPDSTLTVVENSGHVLVRYPDTGAASLGSIRQEAIQEITGSRDDGVTVTRSLDGREQIVGFKRLNGLSSDAPVYLLVGVPADGVRSESLTRMIGTLVSIGLSALFALSFALVGGQSVIVQPIRSLLDSLARLRAGDYRARAVVSTRTPEILALASAFNDMAATIQKRDADVERAGAALRDRERQYRLVFEAAADAMIVSDTETGQILDANGVASQMYGYSQEELLSMRESQLTSETSGIGDLPSDAPMTPDSLQRRRDGSVFAVESSSSLIEVGDRTLKLSSLRDITAKLESERVLRESEFRHRLLFTQMISGFALAEVVLDQEGEAEDLRLLEMNAAFEQQVGAGREQLVGRNVRQLAPHVGTSWIRRLGTVAIDGSPARFTDRLSVIDKELEVNAYSPQPGLVAATFQDVTERRRAERALEQRTRDLEALHEIAKALVGDRGAATAIDRVLELTREALGAEYCELDGTPEAAADLDRPVDERVATGSAIEDPRFVRIAWSGTQNTIPDLCSVAPSERRYLSVPGTPSQSWVDGSGQKPDAEAREQTHLEAEPEAVAYCDVRNGVCLCWLDVAVHGRDGSLGRLRVCRRGDSPPIAEESRFLQAVGHYVGLVLDNYHLSAMATQVELLRQMDRLRSEFIANVSHELRTPLGLIVFLSSALRSEGDRMDESLRTDFVASIEEEAGRLSRLVENLVDVSRLQTGRMRLECEWIDLRDLISGTVDDLAPRLADRVVSVDLPADPLWVYVDRRRIEQVLRNLLVNAVQYSYAGAEIQVGAGDVGGTANVSVRDNGIGIAPNDLPRVFERFYRSDAEPVRQSGGVGLGLAICRSIVQAHGGVIRAESDPRNGTVFTFTVPAPSEPDRGYAPSNESDGDSTKQEVGDSSLNDSTGGV